MQTDRRIAVLYKIYCNMVTTYLALAPDFLDSIQIHCRLPLPSVHRIYVQVATKTDLAFIGLHCSNAKTSNDNDRVQKLTS